MKVWLDGERNEPATWIRARTAVEAITLLQSGAVEEMSLDHDLGNAAGTGYDVLTWIEREVVERGFVPPSIHVHADDPLARLRMLTAVEAIERLAAAPKYDADDGPLTDEQHAAIEKAVKSTVGSSRNVESLFPDENEIDGPIEPRLKAGGNQS